VRALGVVLAVLVGGAVILQATAVGGAWWLRGQDRHDEEIAWLEGFRPVLVWDSALDGHIRKLYKERIRRDLDQGRIDKAVASLRKARARLGHDAVRLDPDLMALGVETFTRAADRMEARGLLPAAAAWDDSLFVMAIRARQPHHRYAALAAFQEGLDLRVRNGEPCNALALVEWAKRGLGGEIPGLPPSIEEDLRIQCAQARYLRRR
jgi:hypothetical protein